MEKRTKQVKFRLTEKELEELNKKVASSGLSREAFIRKILAGAKLRELPTLEYHQFRRELSMIGNNLNQIARIANKTYQIDKEAYSENVTALREFFNLIVDKFQ
ncbi:MAG: plasmid mobilization relaxosome protein MobC [Saccharofermentanales bacterium]